MKMLMGKRHLRRKLADPRIKQVLQLFGSFLGGFCLSRASFGDLPQPFCLGALCAGLPGWLPMSFALGSGVGYWMLWGELGLQGLIWVAMGLPVCILLRRKDDLLPLLISVLAALIVASSGVIFQVWQGEQTKITLYLLRIGVAFGSAAVAQLVQQRREPVSDGLGLGIMVLALTQVGFGIPWFNPGCVAAGFLGLSAPFPGVAMAGLALDMTGITAVPMTAVLCLVYLLRLVPWLPRRIRPMLPGAVYLGVMMLCGQRDFNLLPALLAGGVGVLLLPGGGKNDLYKGETGAMQHRLEMVSGVLAQAEQMLREAPLFPVDEGALMAKAADRACGECPCRSDCPEVLRIPYLPLSMLHGAAVTPEQLPLGCQRKGRLFLELQRSADQYRLLKSDRERQQECRGAVMQQYRFLSEYLQDTAELLSQNEEENKAKFRPEVAVCSRGKEASNGDKCLWFAAPGHRYYVLLCDGMGTGEGAAFESRIACNLLRRLLVAGFPAKYALRSFNSLCVLRHSAGAVTVDLAEADLQTGRATLYKWGAAPSWLLTDTGAERIGREGLPPGLSLEETQETVDRFSLQQGTPLVLLSDGVDGYSAVGGLEGDFGQPAGFLAALLLEGGVLDVPDDATAAVLRLHPVEKA